MRLPRDLSGSELAKSLHKLGYSITRQTGSHLRLTTHEHGEHHLTIPQHTSLRVGTLSALLTDVATHFKCSREEFFNDYSVKSPNAFCNTWLSGGQARLCGDGTIISI